MENDIEIFKRHFIGFFKRLRKIKEKSYRIDDDESKEFWNKITAKEKEEEHLIKTIHSISNDELKKLLRNNQNIDSVVLLKKIELEALARLL